MTLATRRQIILASFALLAAAVLAHYLAPRQLMAKTSANLNLEAVVPKQFGRWTLMPELSPVIPAEPEGYVETDTKTNRIYSQEVSRTYKDGHGNIVMLVVAYGPAQTFRLKAHRPEMCYTAAGFRVTGKTYSSVTLAPTLGPAAHPLSVARLIAEREARFEPISYWMRVGHDITTGIVDRQLIRLKYGLEGLIPDGALMRVSTIGLPREQAFQVQDEFIRELLAAIAPQNRWFFVGT